MVRKSNWEQRLSDYLIAKRNVFFKYGKNDCARFVAGAIRAMTGVNPMKGISRRYNSEIGALRVLKELGYNSVEEFMDDRFKEIPVGFAQTGDVVLYDGSLGIAIDAKAVFVGELGYTFINRSEWLKAWEVGRG